jgi:hypothetical protein
MVCLPHNRDSIDHRTSESEVKPRQEENAFCDCDGFHGTECLSIEPATQGTLGAFQCGFDGLTRYSRENLCLLRCGGEYDGERKHQRVTRQ